MTSDFRNRLGSPVVLTMAEGDELDGLIIPPNQGIRAREFERSLPAVTQVTFLPIANPTFRLE